MNKVGSNSWAKDGKLARPTYFGPRISDLADIVHRKNCSTFKPHLAAGCPFKTLKEPTVNVNTRPLLRMTNTSSRKRKNVYGSNSSLASR